MRGFLITFFSTVALAGLLVKYGGDNAWQVRDWPEGYCMLYSRDSWPMREIRPFVIRKAKRPDVTIFGTSHALFVDESSFKKGTTLLNLSVENARMQESLALWELCVEQNKIPKYVFLLGEFWFPYGVDGWPLGHLEPALERFERRVNVGNQNPCWLEFQEAESAWDEFRSLFSMDRLSHIYGLGATRLRYVQVKTFSPRPWRTSPDIPDGQIAISEQGDLYLRSVSPGQFAQAPQTLLERAHQCENLEPDPSLLEAFASDIHAHGAKVIVVMSPLNSEGVRWVENNPDILKIFRKSCESYEDLQRRGLIDYWASGWDKLGRNCSSTEFLDWWHFDNGCACKVLGAARKSMKPGASNLKLLLEN